MKAVRILAGMAILLCGARLDAQQYFGMNQVQYKHFDWRVIETEHWLVHYYPEERAGATNERGKQSEPSVRQPLKVAAR